MDSKTGDRRFGGKNLYVLYLNDDEDTLLTVGTAEEVARYAGRRRGWVYEIASLAGCRKYPYTTVTLDEQGRVIRTAAGHKAHPNDKKHPFGSYGWQGKKERGDGKENDLHKR